MKYTRLTREERHSIGLLHRQGIGVRAIATQLSRSPSTISRELTNRRRSRSEEYDYVKAQQDSEHKQHGAKARYNAQVWSRVESKLREQWSPEQVTGYYRTQNLPVPSHETIYQYLIQDKRSGGDLYKELRHPLKSYRKRGSGRERRGRIKHQVMIDERPSIVEEKKRIGDWEMDTVIGEIGGEVMVTMVERKSRFTLIKKASSKSAAEVGASILGAMTPLRTQVKTMTFDNGKEFAYHHLLDRLLNSQSYFAHPYHSWERGLNENTNGLIRQYFPKKQSFTTITEAQIKAVQEKLNQRPRKCLGYRTPHDIFYESSSGYLNPPPLKKRQHHTLIIIYALQAQQSMRYFRRLTYTQSIMKIKNILLTIASGASVQAATLVGQVGIDFGTDLAQVAAGYNAFTAAPDGGASAALTDLVALDGFNVAGGVTLTLTNNTDDTADRASAINDNAYIVNDQNSGTTNQVTGAEFITLTFSGLTFGNSYDLTAGYQGGTNASFDADWTIGATTLTTDASATGFITFSDVAASATGEIVITVAGASDPFHIAVDSLVLTGVSTVPEPTSLALLGLGGLALVSRRRRA